METKSKEFQQLKKLWYDKLAKKGFEDAENFNGELKSFHSFEARRSLPGDILVNKAKENYYRLAGHFLHDYSFVNETHKRVWKLHSEGLSYRKIAKYFAEKYNRHYTKYAINEIIKNLTLIMKKKYSEELS